MSELVIVGGVVDIADVREFIGRLAAIGRECGVTAQAVNADLVAGAGHIAYAVRKAEESFREGRNLARDLGMEIMLYLRGRRQIEKALELGLRQGRNSVAIIVVGDAPSRAADRARALLDRADDSVVDYGHGKEAALMRVYDITPAEAEIVGRERIPLLVRERSALLELDK